MRTKNPRCFLVKRPNTLTLLTAAVMSKIICVTLLLIILTDIFCHNTVPGLQVTKGHLRKCRCKVSPSGRLKCRSPLFPQTPGERQRLIKCFCSKTNEHKFKEFQPVCRRWRLGSHTVPLTFV